MTDTSTRSCAVSDCTARYLAKGYCSTHYYRYKYGTVPLDAPLLPGPCIVCGGSVIPSSHGGAVKKYCSKLCRSRRDPEGSRRRNQRRVRDYASYAREKYANDPKWRARDIAKASARTSARRSRVVVDRFTLDDIFERDRARCHLCGKKVVRSEATMDHIVPVSQGGEHSLANVALAHRSCNSGKRDRYMPNGEQLRLVG